MGFLEAGTPLPWPDSLHWLAYVRKHGIEQFLNVYNAVKDRKNDVLKWGDEVRITVLPGRNGAGQQLLPPGWPLGVETCAKSDIVHATSDSGQLNEYLQVQIEYHLVKVNRESGECAVALVAPEVLHDLEEDDRKHTYAIKSAWRPEYGSWMVEATPGIPYGGSTFDLRAVERNMAMRRYRISHSRAMPADTFPVSLVNFPLLGAGTFFTFPPRAPGGPFSRSAYLPDALISPHPRFGTLTANIRRRKGRKVDIQVPLYRDRRTAVGADSAVPAPVTALDAEPRLAQGSVQPPTVEAWTSTHTEATARGDAACSACPPGQEAGGNGTGGACVGACEVGPAHVPVPGHVHMDAMGFGMGCCCLQVTFQARDLPESLFLYDQLAVLAPLMLALTANTPIWRGRLVATDTRWDVISASVDCRTAAERGAVGSELVPGVSELQPAWTALEGAEHAAGHATRPIRQSRYSSIESYISAHPQLEEGAGDALYNDLPLEYDAAAAERLIAAGVHPRLARHVAHLFIRDPLVIFSERTDKVDDQTSTEHFENIQSTNWRSVRWKPPPYSPSPAEASSIGWRVELRTMEAQLTDFENAAYTVFVVLLSRVLLFFDLSLYMPLSLVEANFARANSRDALVRQKFWFRRTLTPLPKHCEPCQQVQPQGAAGTASASGSMWAELSLAEILLGQRSFEAGSGCEPEARAAGRVVRGEAVMNSPSGTDSGSISRSTSMKGRAGEEAAAAAAAATTAAAAAAAAACFGCGSNWGPMYPPPPTPGTSPTATPPVDDFPGLVPLILVYLDFIGCDPETRAMIDRYLRFICGRARGDIMTGATWQRAYVRSHPDYAHDGVVTPRIATDLLCRVQSICQGEVCAPELLGGHAPKPIVFTGQEPEVTPLPHTVEGHTATPAGSGLLSPPPVSPSLPALHSAVSRESDGSQGGSVGQGSGHSVTMLTSPSVELQGAPLMAGTPGGSGRMRGSSFSAEVTTAAYSCGCIRDLVASHAAGLGLTLERDSSVSSVRAALRQVVLGQGAKLDFTGAAAAPPHAGTAAAASASSPGVGRTGQAQAAHTPLPSTTTTSSQPGGGEDSVGHFSPLFTGLHGPGPVPPVPAL